jgi:hypothetical protein
MALTKNEIDSVTSRYEHNAGYFHGKQTDSTSDLYNGISLPSLDATNEEIVAFYSNPQNEESARKLLEKSNLDMKSIQEVWGGAKYYIQNASYLHTYHHLYPDIQLPPRNASTKEAQKFYADAVNTPSISLLNNKIAEDTTEAMFYTTKKLSVYQKGDEVIVETFNGKQLVLNEAQFGTIIEKIKNPSASLVDDDRKKIIEYAVTQGLIEKNSITFQDISFRDPPPAQKLYVFIENDHLMYETSQGKVVELKLKQPDLDIIKDKIKKKQEIRREEQTIILNYAADNGDINHRRIQRYNEAISKGPASAAIAYIYEDYLKANPIEGLSLPSEKTSHQEYMAFYTDPRNAIATRELFNWFEKNRSSAQQWYEQQGNTSSKERRKEVSVREIKKRLTLEHIRTKAMGSVSRFLNDDPLADVLTPDKTNALVDSFMPTLEKTGSIDSASEKTLHETAQFLQQEFVDSGILEEATNDCTELLDYLYADYPENSRKEMLKVDLCMGLIQPIGNYTNEINISNTVSTGRKAAWNRIQNILPSFLKSRIESTQAPQTFEESLSTVIQTESQNFEMPEDAKEKEGTIFEIGGLNLEDYSKSIGWGQWLSQTWTSLTSSFKQVMFNISNALSNINRSMPWNWGKQNKQRYSSVPTDESEDIRFSQRATSVTAPAQPTVIHHPTGATLRATFQNQHGIPANEDPLTAMRHRQQRDHEEHLLGNNAGTFFHPEQDTDKNNLKNSQQPKPQPVIPH